MDKTLPSDTTGSAGSPVRSAATRRPGRGPRAHPLVACLAGGLQAAYAAPPDDAMPDHFADLIARLEREGPGAR